MPFWWRLTILIIVASMTLSAQCAAGADSRVWVVYVNGIDTDYQDAYDSLSVLREMEESVVSSGKLMIDLSCLPLSLNYNPTSGKFFDDLIEALEQLGETDTSKFWKFVYGFLGHLNDFDFVGYVHSYLMRELESQVVSNLAFVSKSNLQSGHLLLIGHSQGNLYVTRVYEDYLTPSEQKSTFAIAVASPGDHVAGGGRHTTLQNDKIALVPRALDVNADNQSCPEVDGISGWLFPCHSFVKSYFRPDVDNLPDPSRPQIYRDFVEAVKSLIATPSPTNEAPSAAFTMASFPYQVVPNGKTLTLVVTPGGSASVSFNATPCSRCTPSRLGSTDPDGKIEEWEWRVGSNVISGEPTFNYPFAAGTHLVSLVVTDDQGQASEIATGTVYVKESSSPLPPCPSDFGDDFDRLDGGVENGWLDATGTDYQISNGSLWARGNGDTTLYRSIDVSRPVTVSSVVTQSQGDQFLGNFGAAFLFGSVGTTQSGYGVVFNRSSSSSRDSRVTLVLNGAPLETIFSPIQFRDFMMVSITLYPDGSLSGRAIPYFGFTTFSFSFGPRNLALLEETIGIGLGVRDGAEGWPTNSTVDNVTISYACNPEPSDVSFEFTGMVTQITSEGSAGVGVSVGDGISGEFTYSVPAIDMYPPSSLSGVYPFYYEGKNKIVVNIDTNGSTKRVASDLRIANMWVSVTDASTSPSSSLGVDSFGVTWGWFDESGQVSGGSPQWDLPSEGPRQFIQIFLADPQRRLIAGDSLPLNLDLSYTTDSDASRLGENYITADSDTGIYHVRFRLTSLRRK